MTVAVANTLLTHTFDYWRQRVNELATAMSNVVITVNSNTTVGNASITGTFRANTLYIDTVTGGNSTVSGVLTFSTNAYFNTNLVTAANTLLVGNSTVNTVITGASLKFSGTTIVDANTDHFGRSLSFTNGTFSSTMMVGANVTVNTSAVIVGANVSLTNTRMAIGNGTVNTSINSTGFFINGTAVASDLSSYLTISSAASTYAPLASPTFTGTPGAPTAANTVSNTQLATTAFVQNVITSKSYLTTTSAAATYLTISTASGNYAPLTSPALVGTPTAPTQANSTANTTIATTEYVSNRLANFSSGASNGFVIAMALVL